jgi:hypothetical protein
LAPDPSIFRSGRDFAAWIGLVPRQDATGGKPRLGGISKRGNSSLRRLLVGGAMAAMFRSKALQHDPWLCQLRARKPVMVAAVAFAGIAKLIGAETYADDRTVISKRHAAEWTQVSWRQTRNAFARARR